MPLHPTWRPTPARDSPRAPWAAVCVAIFWSSPGWAQVAESPRPESVVISGSLIERTVLEAPYAIGVVDQQDIRAAGAMIHASEVLQRLPGLVAQSRSNLAQDLQISSRGFGARSGFGVRGLRIVADGLPATGPDGQGQVSQFDLAAAQRIEVLRGPFSALYGNSSGGVISIISAPITANTFRYDSDVGSFGLRQNRLGIQGKGEGHWEASLTASQAELDGFRPQSGAVKQQAHATLGWRGGRDDVTVQLGYLNQPADDPLGLARAQFESGPRETAVQALQFDTRKTLDQTQLGLIWRHRFDQGVLRETRLSAYGGQRSVAQWLAITPATQANGRHGGGVIDVQRRFQGLEARARWEWDGMGLVAGVAVDQQLDDRRGYENFTGSGDSQRLGVVGRLRRDEVNDARSRDLFAQVEWVVAPRWMMLAGARSGRVDLSSRDAYLSNGDDSGQLAWRYTNPVWGLRWQAQPGLNLHLSAGRGFESPTLGELAYRADGTGGFNTALKAQASTQLEVGLKSRRGRSDLDIVLFEAWTANEIGVATNAGGRSAFQNVGRTSRRGLEAASTWRLGPQWQARLAATVLLATYEDRFLTCEGIPCSTPTAVVNPGQRIAGTPKAWAYAELRRADPMLGHWALEWRAVGSVPVNDRNADFAAGYGLLGARWSRSWPVGGSWRLESLLRLDNVLDRRHAASVIVNDANGRFFEPGAPRHALLSARLVTPL
ncbi:MAG: TonB-dependent receptor [Betaproteobacteria bacterium]|nr:TonB-dependent receptor [Betaproteobacteria bacterium]NBU48567.1 TonB-dependent receptor [Betaproteobacteria bacterium]